MEDRAWGEKDELRSLLDLSPDAVMRFDPDLRYTYVNQAAERIFGLPAHAIAGKTCLEPGLPPPVRTAVINSLSRAFETAQPQRIEVGFPGGVWIDCRIVPEISESGDILSVLLYARDVSALRKPPPGDEQSGLYHALLKAQEDVGEGVVIIEEGRITFANEAACRMAGYTTDEMLALPSFIELVHHDDRARVMENHIRRLAGESFLNRYEMGLLHKDGKRIEAEIAVATVPKGDRLVVIVVVLDITDRKRAEEQIRHMALHDNLTGLPNRLILNDRLRQLMLRSDRHHSRAALLFIDLDGFKPVNDFFGHDTGDCVLREVAIRLLGSVREMDTVARVGGDEFVVLMEDLPDIQGAATVAQKIIDVVSQPIEVRGRACSIGASVGIAIYPDDAKDSDTLMICADNAMYLAKERGKSNYQFFASHPPTGRNSLSPSASSPG